MNLGTADLAVADRIAKAIRHLSGGYRFVKAMGVKLEARGQVQVSINNTAYEVYLIGIEITKEEYDNF